MVGPKLDTVRYASIITVLELLLDFILYIDLTIIWFCLGISTVGNDNRIYMQPDTWNSQIASYIWGF